MNVLTNPTIELSPYQRAFAESAIVLHNKTQETGRTKGRLLFWGAIAMLSYITFCVLSLSLPYYVPRYAMNVGWFFLCVVIVFQCLLLPVLCHSLSQYQKLKKVYELSLHPANLLLSRNRPDLNIDPEKIQDMYEHAIRAAVGLLGSKSIEHRVRIFLWFVVYVAMVLSLVMAGYTKTALFLSIVQPLFMVVSGSLCDIAVDLLKALPSRAISEPVFEAVIEQPNPDVQQVITRRLETQRVNIPRSS